MGSFDFEWKGKTYDILTEGGYPFFDSDEERDAFDEWRVTKEGISLFGPVPTDWSKEHYLDDRYPWDAEKECRVDAEDGNYEEAYIDWCDYEKCRYGCYRHFFLTSDAHVCGKCGVHSCKECAKGSFKKCSDKDEWVCGDHEKCEDHGGSK
mmetsp:Transcript_14833/g.32217  ORF Transcript_14833/g.32217 Transcript_14833/m.32217 type:complete len:151 (-) Transcript_14833:173-625(-)